jgi:type IV pilus assembly protein PilV
MSRHSDETYRRPKRNSAGFSLVEVLVALVVLAIGLLGLAGLQTRGVRDNHGAYLRTQATLCVKDLVDCMRANRPAALAGAYDLGFGIVAPGGDTLAAQDLLQWQTALSQLPGPGQGRVAVDPASRRALVEVSWDDSRGEEERALVRLETEL